MRQSCHKQGFTIVIFDDFATLRLSSTENPIVTARRITTAKKKKV
jgi:hypothetical protein